MVSSLSSDRVAKVASTSRVIRRLYLDSTTGTGGAGRSKHITCIACESSFRLLLTNRAGMTDKDMNCDTSSLFCLLIDFAAMTDQLVVSAVSADSLEAGKTDNNNRRR